MRPPRRADSLRLPDQADGCLFCGPSAPSARGGLAASTCPPLGAGPGGAQSAQGLCCLPPGLPPAGWLSRLSFAPGRFRQHRNMDRKRFLGRRQAGWTPVIGAPGRWWCTRQDSGPQEDTSEDLVAGPTLDEPRTPSRRRVACNPDAGQGPRAQAPEGIWKTVSFPEAQQRHVGGMSRSHRC